MREFYKCDTEVNLCYSASKPVLTHTQCPVSDAYVYTIRVRM